MPRPGVDFPVTIATPQYPDLAYATASPAQKLDLYLPDGPGPFPVVLIVHGGAFMFGDKSHDISMAGTDQLLGRGYAVANVNYRLSGEAKAPAQIQDVKTAVRWLRAHAGEYRLNPHKIGAWGSSAGANLAALLGTSGGVAALEGADLGHAEQSSRVQAVVDWFGPIDFLQMDAQFHGTPCPADHDAPDSPESQLIGAPIQTRPDLVKAVNPITYVSPEASPFLIQHGTEDCLVPPQQSQLLFDALLPAIGADKVQLTLLARRRTRRRPAVLDGCQRAAGARFPGSLPEVEAARMSKTLLVIGAHSADFVWRAAGTIAVITSQGGSATVVALSYGERGESGELWKEPGQTVENVKRIRHEEAAAAAAAVGAAFRCLDLGDYPLNVTDAAMAQLVALFRDLQPDIVLTHTPVDPFNPDHPVAQPGSTTGAASGGGRRRGERLQAHHPARPVLLRAAST